MKPAAEADDRGAPLAVFFAVGGVYVAQSIISGLTFTAFPAVLRERAVALDQIGLIYLAVLPWAIRFLWAPAIERYRLPALGRNRSRAILFVGSLVSAAGLTLAGAVGVAAPFPLLLACFLIVAFAAATVDIVCDGYAVEALRPQDYGWGNAAQVGGAYLGAALGSGLFLILVARLDWALSTWAMAAAVLALALPFLFGPPARAAIVARPHRPALAPALQRPAVRRGLVLAVLYVAAQKWGLAMLPPFLVDSGVSLDVIGAINGIGGVAVGILFAALGGAAVRRFGAGTVLVAGIVLQAAALAVFALLAATGVRSIAVLVALALASSAAILAFGFVALYARFMRLSDPRQGGIDFSLFQCADAATSMVGGLAAGALAQHFGHAAFFALAASIACGALVAMRVLRLAAD